MPDRNCRLVWARTLGTGRGHDGQLRRRMAGEALWHGREKGGETRHRHALERRPVGARRHVGRRARRAGGAPRPCWSRCAIPFGSPARRCTKPFGAPSGALGNRVNAPRRRCYAGSAGRVSRWSKSRSRRRGSARPFASWRCNPLRPAVRRRCACRPRRRSWRRAPRSPHPSWSARAAAASPRWRSTSCRARSRSPRTRQTR